jgi:RecB family exonuclease
MTEPSPILPGAPLESAIAAAIARRLGDRSCVFVFPSQVAADSWAEASLGLPGVAALEKDRFLGWDKFLERATLRNAPAGRSAAGPAERLVWALAAIAEQLRRPFLRILAKPGQEPPLSLAPNLARLAPALRGLARDLARGNAISSEYGQREEIADYLALSAAYDRFLDAQGLFETSHLEPSFDGRERFVIFEPALMPNFQGLEARLAAAPGIELVSAFNSPPEERAGAGNDKPAPTLRTYATFRDEIQDVLSQCANLIDAGLEPSAIAISAPSLTPDIQAHLGAMARKYGLTLAFHAGELLSASPFGRLLRELSGAQAEGFSLRTLRALFGRGALAWKDPKAAAALIRYAARYCLPEFSADRPAMAALWKKTFASCPSPLGAEARAFYDALTAAAAAISGARSFDALRRALHDFLDDFLETPRRGSLADRSIENTFNGLDGLDAGHRRLGAPTLAATPFETLLIALDTTTYSPPQSANAIAVYPYRLAMLLASAVHFVIEASQESLDSTLARYSPAPKELAVFLPPEKDSGDLVFRSFDAVRAVYCHAESSLSGFTVPHPFFLREGIPAEEIAPGALPASPDTLETMAWRNLAPGTLPARFPRPSEEAALGLLGGELGDKPLGEPGGGRFPPPVLTSAAQPRGGNRLDPSLLLALPSCDASPLVKLSPSRLKSLQECPFKWFASCLPELDSGAGTANTAEGSLAHALIRMLLQRIQETDGGFIAARLDEYRGWIDETFDRALEQTLRQQGPALEPSLSAARLKIQDRVERLLDFEEAFAAEGWEIGDFEVALSMPLESLGVSFEGRADRIATLPPSDGALKNLAIIDYKKGNTPKKSEFLVNAESLLRDFQLAGYAAMAESAGALVEKALYWSIEAGKAVYVFGSGKHRPDRESFKGERQALQKALDSAAEIIGTGKFLDAMPGKLACQNCGAKALCRALYSSERL